jgi:glycosyltransferase involved in cell wall biosynthesis
VRILHVNKFLYRRGGAESYMEDLASLQAQAGHHVEFFAMAHPENRPARFGDRFPAHIELEPPPPSFVGKVRGAGRVLWSTSARRGMAEVADDFAPDVVHLHNVYHQLSPSVLQPLARLGLPTVMTLHDYKLACPTYQFLDNGSPCEACIDGGFREAVKRRCKGGSLSASALCATESWLHRRTGAYGPVARFVSPSRFLAAKMARAGVYPDRLRWVPHFVDHEAIAPKTDPGGDVVFAGRLSAEKGVDTLIAAMGRLGPGTVVRVAGEGPERERLEALAADVAPGQVIFHGRLGKADLLSLLRSACVVAVPSCWYENQPMIVLEALASGVPVVASDIGGLPELVEPGVTGALFPPGDAEALASALAPLLAQPERALAMGRAGRAEMARTHAPAVHLARLDDVYHEAGASLEVTA